MANVQQCMRDGYSTAGSPGTGLGAMARMSSLFDITSTPGKGPAVMSRLWRSALPKPLFEVGALSLPKPGESACGDAWAASIRGDRLSLIVVDGLGHGMQAADAARAAIEVFQESPALAPAEILALADRGLRHSRGAAVSVIAISDRIEYCGIGNVSGAIVSADRTRFMVSQNGTVGVQVRKLQSFAYDLPEQAVIVLCSDGIMSSWGFESYPGLLHRHPSLIAAVMYRDFWRATDDVTFAAVSPRGWYEYADFEK